MATHQRKCAMSVIALQAMCAAWTAEACLPLDGGWCEGRSSSKSGVLQLIADIKAITMSAEKLVANRGIRNVPC